MTKPARHALSMTSPASPKLKHGVTSYLAHAQNNLLSQVLVVRCAGTKHLGPAHCYVLLRKEDLHQFASCHQTVRQLGHKALHSSAQKQSITSE